jgi:hypothetical protein
MAPHQSSSFGSVFKEICRDAPVVQSLTVNMLLVLVLREEWVTHQVKYKNAFAQSELHDKVYVDPQKLFAPANGKYFVLKLLKSLYGLQQAPNTFYEKLSAGLLGRGFVKSLHDPCLVVNCDLLRVIYVDDSIFAGPDEDQTAKEYTGLPVGEYETKHKFQL